MSQKEGNAMRRGVIQAIDRLSSKYPDLRITQLIGNATPSEEAQKLNNDLYYVEDSQLLEWLLGYERKLEAQRASTRESG